MVATRTSKRAPATKKKATRAKTFDSRLVDLMSTPAFVTDGSGKVLAWNEAMTDCTGRSATKVVGKRSWAGFYPRTETTPVVDALDECDVVESEIEFKHSETEQATRLTLRVTPIFESGKKPAALLGEVVSRASTGGDDELVRFRSAVEGSTSATMMVDRDLVITYVNPATVRLVKEHEAAFSKIFTGFNPDKLIGTCIDTFHKNPEHQRRILSNPANLPHTADISVGDLWFRLNVSAMVSENGEHIGSTLEWKDITEERQKSLAAARLSSQIEGSATGVMVCDMNRRITYCNPAVMSVLRTYEAQIKQVLPQFDINNLNGQTIDIFHKNPSHQKSLIDDPSRLPHRAEISVGLLEFGLNLTALYDDAGNQIGAAVEWSDLNDRAEYRREVERVISAAKHGDLSVRGDVSKLSDSFKPMMTGINEVIEAIVAPIQEAQSVLQKIANKDLSARVVGEYMGDHARIKNDLNEATGSLDEALSQVSHAVLQVESASQQISGGAQNLAQATSTQASTLEEITTTLDQVTVMTDQNAESASQARSLAESARDSAAVGRQSMSSLSEAIDRIKASSDETAKIIKTIDEIAFQTNLLALNAAVEAARAGEAGRGFAVVAEEVRSLAQRSAEAAKSTATMIASAVRNAEDGVRLGAEVAEQLNGIATGAGQVNDIVTEISGASNEQAKAIKQINVAVGEVNGVTQQNAANSEQSASTSEELGAQASALTQMVDSFRLSGNPRRTIAGAVVSAPPPGLASTASTYGHSGTNGHGHNGKMRPNRVIPLTEDELA